jgi:hypothetical protein
MRKLLIVCLLLVLSIAGAAVSAQEQPTFCGDLSPADCALLEASAAAMSGLESGAFDFSLQINAVGLPDTPDINLSVVGNGAFQADVGALDLLAEPTSGQEALDIMVAALRAFSGEISLTLTVPDAVAMEMGMPFTQVTLDLALVGGVGYINFTTLDEALGGMLAMEGMSGWTGLDFTEIVTMFGPMFATQPEFDEIFQAGAMTPTMDEEAIITMMEQYASIERQADAGGAAVFVTTINMGGLLGDANFQQMMRDEIGGQAGVDPMEIEQAFMMLSFFGDGISAVSTSSIDLTTNFVRSETFVMDIDLAMLAAMAGESADGAAMNLAITINYSDHNATTVSAPAGATIIPTMELFELMGSF